MVLLHFAVILPEDIPVSNITYTVEFGKEDASIILSIPHIPKMIGIEIKNQTSGSVIGSLREDEIDDSKYIQVFVRNLSTGTNLSLEIEVTGRFYNGSNSTAQQTYFVSTDMSLCISCSPNSTCIVRENGEADCLCIDGYTGDGSTCVLINSCDSSPCDSNATCTDTEEVCEEDPGYSCTCKSGFTGTGEVCNDIKECEIVSNCHANATCKDVPGNYTCTCKEGFTGDGKFCEDIKECENVSNCHTNATCKDVPGNYTCTCKEGFTGDGKFCEDIKECENVSNCHPNATCKDVPGNYTCTCKEGFTGDGKYCEDIKECENVSNCHTNATCRDVPGNYTCACKEGFTGDGKYCEDIKECENVSNCHPNATCKDVPGNFTCTCKEGFKGDGKFCEDIKECENVSNCHPNATCKDVPGNYTCTCNDGFTGNGKFCEDIKECENVSNCHANATCKDVPGNYICTCKEGFKGDGKFCEDIKECENVSTCHPNATCKDVPGNYTCTCKDGFTGDGHKCTELPVDCEFESNSTSAFVTCDANEGVQAIITMIEMGSVISLKACEDISDDQKQSIILNVINGSTAVNDLIPGTNYRVVLTFNDTEKTILLKNDTFITDTVLAPQPTYNSVSNDSIVINWSKQHSGTAFIINFRGLEGNDVQRNTTITKPPWVVAGLESGKRYETCIQILFCTFPSGKHSCSETYTLPSYVADIQLSLSPTSIEAEWTAVRGSSHYVANLTSNLSRKRRALGDSNVVLTNETSVVFNDLLSNTGYILSIAAANSAGQGEAVTRKFTSLPATSTASPFTLTTSLAEPSNQFPWWWIVVGVVGLILLILGTCAIIRLCMAYHPWCAKLDVTDADPAIEEEDGNRKDDDRGCCSWRAILMINNGRKPSRQRENGGKSQTRNERSEESTCCPWRALFSVDNVQQPNGRAGVDDRQVGEEEGCCLCWNRRLWINRGHQNRQEDGHNHREQDYAQDNDLHAVATDSNYETIDSVDQSRHSCCPWVANLLITGEDRTSANSTTGGASNGDADRAYTTEEQNRACGCCPWTAEFWVSRREREANRTSSSAQPSGDIIYDVADDPSQNACCPWTAKLWITKKSGKSLSERNETSDHEIEQSAL